MPKLLARTLFALFICAFLVIGGYFFLDKPVAFLMHDLALRNYKIFEWFTWIAPTLVIIALFSYLSYAIRFAYHKIMWVDKLFLGMANSIVITSFIKDQLKKIFGRYWPETWVNNNPSFIHNNAYGFHFFHAGKAYSSFPSGHTAITVSAMMILWLAHPKLRWLAALLTLLIVIGLLGNDYHFLTDIIAGAFLGGIIAIFVANNMDLIYKK